MPGHSLRSSCFRRAWRRRSSAATSGSGRCGCSDAAPSGARPAGYGKTALVAAAAAELGWEPVWYPLDALDADQHAFLERLSLAIGQRLPGFDAREQQPSASPGSGAAVEAAARLAGEVARHTRDELYLILDDYEALVAEAAIKLDPLVALAQRLRAISTPPRPSPLLRRLR